MAAALKLIQGGRKLDDADIKILAKTNREAASAAIIKKYRDPIYHHAGNILKDWEEAIDVTQEVFIKSMRETRFFDDEFQMKAWLYRVTSNLCFNMVRDRRRRSAILDGMQKQKFTSAGQMDRVFETQQQEQVFHAMQSLTENHRKILMLRFYNDLSYAEIAETLNVKLGTVMSRLSRAKTQLMEVVSDVEGLNLH